MDKTDFFKILCTYTPEELNEFISSKGKIKMVNAVTFLDNEKSQEEKSDGANNSEFRS